MFYNLERKANKANTARPPITALFKQKPVLLLTSGFGSFGSKYGGSRGDATPSASFFCPHPPNVTISSATVGWIATAASKSFKVAPILTATANPCNISSFLVRIKELRRHRKRVMTSSGLHTAVSRHISAACTDTMQPRDEAAKVSMCRHLCGARDGGGSAVSSRLFVNCIRTEKGPMQWSPTTSSSGPFMVVACVIMVVLCVIRRRTSAILHQNVVCSPKWSVDEVCAASLSLLLELEHHTISICARALSLSLLSLLYFSRARSLSLRSLSWQGTIHTIPYSSFLAYLEHKLERCLHLVVLFVECIQPAVCEDTHICQIAQHNRR